MDSKFSKENNYTKTPSEQLNNKKIEPDIEHTFTGKIGSMVETHKSNIDVIKNDNFPEYINSNNKNSTKTSEIRIINKNTGEITYVDESKATSFLDNEMKNIFIPKNTFTKPWDDFWTSHKTEKSHLLSCVLKKDYKSIEAAFSINDQELISEYLNNKYTDDQTLLHFSSILSDAPTTELLLKKGANPNSLSKMKRTPLHLSSIFNCLEIAKILIKYNADINAVDIDNNTALHYICENGFEEILYLIINKNPDFSLKNKSGKTALELSANQIISNIIKGRLQENKSDKYDERNDFIKSVIFNVYNNRKSFHYNSNENSPNQLPSLLTCSDTHDIHVNQTPKLDKFAQLKKFAKVKQKEQILFQYVQQEASYKDFSIINASLNKQSSQQIKKTNLYLDLNSYVLLAKIGSGAFGVVFLVECKIDQIRYALKLIKKDHIFSHNIIKYMKSEQNVLASSKNPFIVEMKCSFQDKNFLYLVMEYCPGGDLAKLLKRSPNYRLEEEVARKYLAQIFIAIRYLHSKDTIYRDLKPENIAFDSKGNAKIVDFGLSKEGITGQKETDTFLGTENYLAPEMISKKGHGKALDWYMFGVLAFEILTGRVPFFQQRGQNYIKCIEIMNPQYPKFLSNDAVELLDGLLSKDPKKRLGSGIKGSEEIMKCKFFKPINWEDVINLKMEMPKPPIIKYNEKVMNLKDCIRISSNEYDDVQNFTFIENESKS